MWRRRLTFLILIVLTIILGLTTRRYAAWFPRIIGDYAPDALWAMLIYWLMGFCAIRAKQLRLAITALMICYAVEISQLYHAPWIDAIRANRLGGLVLGFGFLWSDLICYTVGVILATAIDSRLRWRSELTSFLPRSLFGQKESVSWRER